MSTRQNLLSLALASILLLGAAATAIGSDELGPYRPEWGLGPIDFRNEFAISQAYLSLAADSPATPDRGQVQVSLRGDWAKTIVDERSIGAVLDTETLDFAPAIAYGLTDRIQLGLELPVLHRFPGVLDHFIVAVEGGVTGNVRREHRDLPPNRFNMSGSTDDGRRYDLPEGTSLGKLRLGAKVRFTDGDALLPAASLELVAALPTGRPGFTTSGTDVGARLALSKRVADDWVIYLGGTAVLPGGSLGEIQIEPLKGVGFGAVEYEIRPWLSAVGNIWAETPTVKNLDGARGVILYFGVGLKGSWDRYFAEVGVLENGADVTRSADITFHAEIGVTLW
jgi:hypothetical protein